MRRRVVGIIFRRELRDVVRDRRTLFTMLILPVILYPALMLGFSQLTVTRARDLLERELTVMVTVDGLALSRDGPDPPPRSLEAFLLEVEHFRFLDLPDPEAALEEGRLHLLAAVEQDVAGRLRRGEEVTLVPVYRSASEVSAAAMKQFLGAVERFRLASWPLRVDEKVGDRSTAQERGGQHFGGMLAMLVVLMAMTGAFYPALDVAAGEKERGTLETLLLSPASRGELVTGKYLTVLTVAVVAALMNLGSLTLTFSGFTSLLGSGPAGSLNFTIPPRAFLVILAGLLLMAGLFSAVCLALSTFARTYKEGQAYLTPALLVVMPLSMVAILPDLRLDLGTALLPVANLTLMMKGLLVGEVSLAPMLLTLASLSLLGLAALHWAASLFEREEVLFREGRQVFGLRPPPGVARPARPGAGAALLGFLLGLAFLFHVGTRLASRGAVVSLTLTLVGLAAIALLLGRLSLAPLRSGLGILKASRSAWIAGVVLGVVGVAISGSVAALQVRWLGPAEAAARELEAKLAGVLALPAPVVLVFLGVLPAIAEEVLFRGLILQGLRGALGDRGALIASALGFGFFHLDPHRFFPQTVLGLILGALVLRGGSLLPAVAAHAVHNSVLVGMALALGTGEESLALPEWVGLPALLLALLALHQARARLSD